MSCSTWINKSLAVGLISLILPAAAISLEGNHLNPSEALERLLAGNQRYMHDKLLHPNRDQERREAVTAKQKPYASILGCSDSRVSPEIVFDEGIGDIFVVRVAGNVVGPIELDSLEYAALNLGSALILVLGHESCGAVNAVLHNHTEDIEAIAEKIAPVIRQINPQENDALEKAVKANTKAVVEELLRTPQINSLVANKKVNVVGGYYNLKTGEVEILTK